MLDSLKIHRDFVLDPSFVLYLPLYELDGAKFSSKDAYGHVCTRVGALWRLDGTVFDGSDDYIELEDDDVATSPLNFTSGDFSLIARIKADAFGDGVTVFERGALTVGGYLCHISAAGIWTLFTSQSGVLQQSSASTTPLSTATCYTLGLTRHGASVRCFVNGLDKTTLVGEHIDPATSTEKARVGIRDDLTTQPFDGKIEFLAVWRRVLSHFEHRNYHNYLSWRANEIPYSG